MAMFAIGLLTMAGLIPVIVKLAKAEEGFSQAVDKEHEKTTHGIVRYNDMKSRPE